MTVMMYGLKMSLGICACRLRVGGPLGLGSDDLY